MPEVATAQSVEQRFTPSSEQVQKHDEFRHIMILLLLATTINYGHAALPDPAYQLQFHSLGGFFFFFFLNQQFITRCSDAVRGYIIHLEYYLAKGENDI